MTKMTSLYQDLPSPDSFRILQVYPGIGAVSGDDQFQKFNIDALQEPLICDLVEAKLSQKSQYEALSYRWTDPNKENPDLAYCNGFECPIGPNLHAALIRFRLADAPRALWVDQLCINQAEGPETAQQLLVMCDIYSKAERVLSWLGPAYDDSDKAMDLFPKLVDRLEALDLEKKLEKEDHDMSIDGFKYGQAFYKLFSRPYFSRVWTLQELAVSNDITIVCGDAELPFAVLERFIEGFKADSFGHWGRALRILNEGKGPESPRLSMIPHLLVVLRLKALDSSAFPPSSASVLNLLRHLECSKSNDRVYSLLRFLPPTLAESLVAAKRKSTEALFIDLATSELTEYRTMDFLSAAGMCQHRRCYPSRRHDQLRPMLKLPTWVPDWTYCVKTRSLWVMNDASILKEYGPIYQTAGSSRGDARLVISDDIKVLRVQGKVFDDIAACVEPFDFPVVSRNHREGEVFRQSLKGITKPQMKEHWELLRKNEAVTYARSMAGHLMSQTDSCIALAKDCKRYDDDIGRTTACRQTLLGGTVSRNRSVLVGEQVKATNEEVNQLFTEWELTVMTYDLLKPFLDVVRRHIDPEGSKPDEADILILFLVSEMMGKVKRFKWDIWSAYKAIKLACMGRRFFTTTKGFMGLAPDIAEVGDKVCLIAGCCTPFIIRPEGPNYALVGESYVHGVMDGELMSDITFEDINLV